MKSQSTLAICHPKLIAQTVFKKLWPIVASLLKAYSAIFFLNNIFIGGAFLIATLWYPNAGIAGLLAAFTALLAGRILNLPSIDEGLPLYNSLLVGLSLGASYYLTYHLVLIIILAALLAVFISAALADYLWRLDRLSPLSLPFVITAFTAALAAQSYSTLNHYLAPKIPYTTQLPSLLEAFLTAMGSALFTPHPYPGLLIFLALLFSSRYLALLAVSGFFTGETIYLFLNGGNNTDLIHWIGFNFILTSLAIGGIFTLPGLQSFLLAMVGAAIAAFITAACQSFLLIYGLPVMAIPFLIVTLTLLIALRKRMQANNSLVLLDSPALPEQSSERARLAKYRGASNHSVLIQAPFLATWQVYQGFYGMHTHQAPWQHALDFYQTLEGRSFASHGQQLTNYYCFGLPICSPAYGQVVRCQQHIADNNPGEVNTQDNWGNFILIRLSNGYHVLLAHLKQHSVNVAENEWITAGQIVAQCGNSGRSPQPHLHLHVQRDAILGSATLPFHLNGVLTLSAAPKKLSEEFNFHLVSLPKEGESISPSNISEPLKAALHLPVGRRLHYQVNLNEKVYKTTLTVELTLTGQFRIHSENGASAAFIETDKVIAFFDRTGPKDLFLDAWLLAFGLTPLTDKNIHWNDSATAQLLPLSAAQKLLLQWCRPMGLGLTSRYHRTQLSNEGYWLQSGSHQCAPLPNSSWQAETQAYMTTSTGFSRFSLTFQNQRIEAILAATELSADNGIPQAIQHHLPFTQGEKHCAQ